MGRRVLAFFLGMIFGIIFFIGAIAGGILIAATVIKPSDLSYDSVKYLGDLANMSLLDIYKSVSELYRSKVGITDENGQYFTFGQFCEKYNINPSELFGGKPVPQEVLDVPIFELIGGDRNMAMNQIRVSVIPALLNMFAGGEQGEDGSANAMFPDSVLEKLSAFSMNDLMAEDGIATVFADVRLSEMALGMLPLDKTEDNSLIWAIGQAKLGPLLGGMDGNMLLEFKLGGAFDEMGKLPLTELLGDASTFLTAIFGENALADLIDAEGNLNPDDMINDVYLGDLVNLQRNLLDEAAFEGYTETDLKNDNYTLWQNGDDFALVKVVEKEGEEEPRTDRYEAKLVCTDEDEEHVHTIDCYGFVWYSTTAAEEEAEGDLVLDGVHYAAATGLYAAIADVTIGMMTDPESDALMDKMMNIPLNELLEGQEMSGMFENLSDMTIGELIDGGIDDMYLGQLLGFRMRKLDEQPEGNVIELYKNETPEEDEEPSKYLIKDAEGNVLGLSPDGKTWYEGGLTCIKEEHQHTAECGVIDPDGKGEICGLEEHTHNVAGCFGFVWYEQCENAESDHTHEGEWVPEDNNDEQLPFVPLEGMMAKLSNKQIADMSNLDDAVKEFTLADVMGDDVPDILDSIKDTPIGDMNDAINDMYLGELLSFKRRPLTEGELATYTKDVTDINGNVIDGLKCKLVGEGDEAVTEYAKLADDIWYEARLTCIEKEVPHTEECGAPESCTDETHHVHDASCYGFWWYEKCENTQEDHTHEGEWLPEGEEEYYVRNNDMMGKLADEQVKNLGNLNDKAKELTLGEVMGDDLPGMLSSLKDTPVGKLDEAIDNMYLGELLEYRRKTLKDLGKDEADFDNVTLPELTDEEGKVSDGAVKIDKDGNAIKQAGEMWYEAALTCTKKEVPHDENCGVDGADCTNEKHHVHDASCYGFVWYKVCEDVEHTDADAHAAAGDWLPTEDNDENNYYIVADGMMGKLANEHVGNMGNLNETVQEFTLQDVMGDNVPEMLESLKDTPINEMDAAIDNVYLGDFLHYKRRPVDVPEDRSGYTVVFETDEIVVVETQDGAEKAYAKTEDDGETWYEAVYVCDKEEKNHTDDCGGEEGNCTDETHHVHGVDCYDFVWYEKIDGDHECDKTSEWIFEDKDGVEVHYIPTTGMMSKLAREKVGDMGDLDETIKDFTLADVLGDDVPDMLGSIKDEKIGNLNDAINGMYLGDFLEYRRKTVTEIGEGVTENNYGATVGGATLPELTDETGKVTDGEVRLDTSGNAIKQGGDIWYEAALTCTKKEVPHDENCGVDGADCTNEKHHVHDASCYGYVWYKVCDIVDHTEADHHKAAGEWLPTEDNDENNYYIVADGMMGKLANERVDELGDLNDTIQSFTLQDVMGDNVPESLLSLADVPIGELGGAIDDMYLGAFLKYVKKPVDVSSGYADMTGPDELGKLKRNTADSEHFALLGDDGIWYDAAMYCTKEEHTHDASCEGLGSCDKEEHTHSLDCYRFNWYTLNCKHEGDPEHVQHTDDCYVAADKLIGRLARLKVSEMDGDTITDTVNDTPLGDVLTLDNANGLLKELKDVKIGDLSDELDAVYVGVAMNFERNDVTKEVAGKTFETVAKDTNEKRSYLDEIVKVQGSGDGKLYYHDVKNNVYYEAQLTCKKELHTHETDVCGDVDEDGKGSTCGKVEHKEHTFRCYGFVWYDCDDRNDADETHSHGTPGGGGQYPCSIAKGLNGKIANLRIDELTGSQMTGIAQDLTVGDIMDSGMMTLEPENIALLAIIFEEDLPEGQKHDDCNLTTYLMKKATSPESLTAEQFWQEISEHHGSPSEEHGYEWKNMLLVDFVSEMLNIVNKIQITGGVG